jgi:hypothetical protein
MAAPAPVGVAIGTEAQLPLGFEVVDVDLDRRRGFVGETCPAPGQPPAPFVDAAGERAGLGQGDLVHHLRVLQAGLEQLGVEVGLDEIDVVGALEEPQEWTAQQAMRP